LLSAWRGLPRFEGRSSLRSWLYRIATNTCLNAMRSTARQVQTEPTPPFQPPEPTQRDEITWLQPYPDNLLDGIPDSAPGPEARYSQTEAIQLAFVAGLQRMPPRQAATVLLRDVLGFGTDEVAAMLKTSQTAVKGTLQRGRAALESSWSQGAHQLTPDRPRSTISHGVLPSRTSLPTSTAWSHCSLMMRGCPCLRRRTNTTASMRSGPSFRPASTSVETAAFTCSLAGPNHQPALASYLSDQEESMAKPAGLFVLTFSADRIKAMTRFHRDDLYPRLGFPDSLSVSE
jgi:RNA polymerase sigma-70 factor (ECF subfamily)